MRFTEFKQHHTDATLIDIFEVFLPFVMKELNLKGLPPIKLCLKVPDDTQPTFGKFVNEEGKIYLGIEDRHPLDIIRTLAHELVHFKQGKEHKLGPDSGDTGSPIENEAHELAGIVMRKFNKANPEFFNASAVNTK